MFVNQIEECQKIIDTLPGANYSEEEKTKMFYESKTKLAKKWYVSVV